MAWLRLRRAPEKALGRLAGAASPVGEFARAGLPSGATAASALRLLAVDVETTGFDPARDQLLSIGFVPVDGHTIRLEGARRIHVRPQAGAEVGVSATIHGLTDDLVAAGVSAREAVDALATALTGRVLLAHHAKIEVGFLGAACRTAYGLELPLRTVDTMELARRALPGGWQREPQPGELRLWTVRERFGLPTYAAHDALQDALACAELYLAQLAELEHGAAKAVTLDRLAS